MIDCLVHHAEVRSAHPPRVPVAGWRFRDGRTFDKIGPDLAPLPVKSVEFPPVDGAPVLAVVKQTALDGGCGAALRGDKASGTRRRSIWASDSWRRSPQVGGPGNVERP